MPPARVREPNASDRGTTCGGRCKGLGSPALFLLREKRPVA